MISAVYRARDFLITTGSGCTLLFQMTTQCDRIDQFAPKLLIPKIRS